ncbi:MAG: hypothetical protein ACFHHU_03305 [Porticoccaceae bacterium]
MSSALTAITAGHPNAPSYGVDVGVVQVFEALPQLCGPGNRADTRLGRMQHPGSWLMMNIIDEQLSDGNFNGLMVWPESSFGCNG